MWAEETVVCRVCLSVAAGQHRCVFCDKHFGSVENVLEHARRRGHFGGHVPAPQHRRRGIELDEESLDLPQREDDDDSVESAPVASAPAPSPAPAVSVLAIPSVAEPLAGFHFPFLCSVYRHHICGNTTGIVYLKEDRETPEPDFKKAPFFRCPRCHLVLKMAKDSKIVQSEVNGEMKQVKQQYYKHGNERAHVCLFFPPCSIMLIFYIAELFARLASVC